MEKMTQIEAFQKLLKTDIVNQDELILGAATLLVACGIRLVVPGWFFIEPDDAVDYARDARAWEEAVTRGTYRKDLGHPINFKLPTIRERS